MSAADGLAPTTRVGRVALTVRSLEETLPFYRDVVGLALHEHTGGSATLGAPDRPLLELFEAPTAQERPPTAAGLYHYAIRVPTRPALGAALERIEANWQLDGASDHGVSEALYLHDPVGNGIEIYWDRPREEWPEDGQGGVAMETAPLDLDAIRRLSNDGATLPVDTVVGHVHLEVTDISAARAFYVDALGMNVRAQYGADALFLAAGDYHHHVGLNTWNGRSEPMSEGTVGLAWYELIVPDASELRRVVNRLLENGVDVRGDVGKLRVEDPSGISIRMQPGVGVASTDDASAERSG